MINELDVALMSAEDLRAALNLGLVEADLTEAIFCAHRVCPERLDAVVGWWRRHNTAIYSETLYNALKAVGYEFKGKAHLWHVAP